MTKSELIEDLAKRIYTHDFPLDTIEDFEKWKAEFIETAEKLLPIFSKYIGEFEAPVIKAKDKVAFYAGFSECKSAIQKDLEG